MPASITSGSSSVRSASRHPELIRIAIKSLGLDELAPFKPEERIIEYRLRDTGLARLVG